MTTSATVVIFDGQFTVSVTGEDYEASDYSVGLQGGFTNFVLDSAFNTATKEDLSEADLNALDTRIQDNPYETERILDALDAAYDPGFDD